MKLRIYVEVEVSKTIAETIKRSGFVLEPDGTGMKVSITNAPSIPKRKTQVRFVNNPPDLLDDAVASSMPVPVDVNSVIEGE